jgi:hypothetical protein
LCDSFQVPKPLSPQLQAFGKSNDDLGELTFEVGLFFCSVRASRTVRVVLADGPRRACSSGVLRGLACLSFRSVMVLSFGWTKFRTVRVWWADGPRVPGGQSVCSTRTVHYSRCVYGGSGVFFGQFGAQAGRSAARVRTVCDTLPDSPRGPCGPSALPGRTVRHRLAALLLDSIPPFPSRASACASRNRS